MRRKLYLYRLDDLNCYNNQISIYWCSFMFFVECSIANFKVVSSKNYDGMRICVFVAFFLPFFQRLYEKILKFEQHSLPEHPPRTIYLNLSLFVDLCIFLEDWRNSWKPLFVDLCIFLEDCRNSWKPNVGVNVLNCIEIKSPFFKN